MASEASSRGSPWEEEVWFQLSTLDKGQGLSTLDPLAHCRSWSRRKRYTPELCCEWQPLSWIWQAVPDLHKGHGSPASLACQGKGAGLVCYGVWVSNVTEQLGLACSGCLVTYLLWEVKVLQVYFINFQWTLWDQGYVNIASKFKPYAFFNFFFKSSFFRFHREWMSMLTGCYVEMMIFCLMEWFKENGRTSQMNYMNVYSAFQDRASDRSSGKQMLRGQARIMLLRDSTNWHVIVRSFPPNMANACYTWRMLNPKWDSLLFWEVCKSPEIQCKSEASVERWLSS